MGAGEPGGPGGRLVAVVGGGIAGLAAAWELASASPRPRVVVLEASGRLGGKIRTGEVGGRLVDLGPDAFLARRPEATALCRELGIADELVPPGSRRAYVWSRGRLRALPDGLALGIPTRLAPVLRSGILSPLGLLRAGADLVGLPAAGGRRPGSESVVGDGGSEGGGDRAVGEIVARRLGREVVDRFVDPLIGGIHAGPVATMSAAAVYPPLLEASTRPGSLVRALRAAVPVPPPGATDAPVFLTPHRGLGRLVGALAAALESKGVELRTSDPVGAMARAEGGWRLGCQQGTLEADAVVLATPAPAAAGLLAPVDPALARLLARVEHAEVAVITFVVPAGSVGRILDGTGFLVPAVEGWLTTACTWMSTKWPHLSHPGEVLVRASVGRFGDERAGAMDDDELAEAVFGELRGPLSITGGPDAARVTRWPGAFPQYAVGHLALVDAVEQATDALGDLAVAGAAYRGVGIPACIASGRRAARRVLGIDADDAARRARR